MTISHNISIPCRKIAQSTGGTLSKGTNTSDGFQLKIQKTLSKPEAHKTTKTPPPHGASKARRDDSSTTVPKRKTHHPFLLHLFSTCLTGKTPTIYSRSPSSLGKRDVQGSAIYFSFSRNSSLHLFSLFLFPLSSLLQMSLRVGIKRNPIVAE
jgi:hypothetical protein